MAVLHGTVFVHSLALQAKKMQHGWHMWFGTHVWSIVVLRTNLSTVCWTTWTWNWQLKMLWRQIGLAI
jgi:hypothetical protein